MNPLAYEQTEYLWVLYKVPIILAIFGIIAIYVKRKAPKDVKWTFIGMIVFIWSLILYETGLPGNRKVMDLKIFESGVLIADYKKQPIGSVKQWDDKILITTTENTILYRLSSDDGDYPTYRIEITSYEENGEVCGKVTGNY